MSAYVTGNTSSEKNSKLGWNKCEIPVVQLSKGSSFEPFLLIHIVIPYALIQTYFGVGIKKDAVKITAHSQSIKFHIIKGPTSGKITNIPLNLKVLRSKFITNSHCIQNLPAILEQC